jgi:hypothetical protein
MGALEEVRLRDRTTRGGAGPAIDLSGLTGSWSNTETRSRWLARIDVRSEGDQLLIRPRGGDPRTPGDWGERAADVVCATAIDSSDAGGYIATFPLGAIETELQATLNQGLLVVLCFNRTGDPATAPGIVTREFFRRTGAGA